MIRVRWRGAVRTVCGTGEQYCLRYHGGHPLAGLHRGQGGAQGDSRKDVESWVGQVILDHLTTQQAAGTRFRPLFMPL